MAQLLFFIFALLGVPLFAIFGGLSLYLYKHEGISAIAMISEYYKLASQPVLLTIPLFTFAGYLLAESNAPTRLVNVAKALFGWMPGALAIVTIVSCAFFTAFTGASGVTIIALGGLLYPVLMQEKYGDKFSMGLVTSCGSIGLLFAPSLPLILYGLIGKVSIDKLFIAGAVPCILIMMILFIYSGYIDSLKSNVKLSLKEKLLTLLKIVLYNILMILLFIVTALILFAFYKGINSLGQFVNIQFSTISLVCVSFAIFLTSIIVGKRLYPKNKAFIALSEAIWELPLPFIILVGIYGGYITPSEAAAVTAFYVLVVEVFVYRDINIFSDVPRIIRESMLLVGGILIILGVAMGLTNFMVDQQVPDHIFAWVKQFIHSKWAFLVTLNLFLIVVGMMMDIFSAIIVVVPIITPIAIKYGVNPIHLAVIFLTNLEIGYLTPPVGLNLFISSFRFKRPVIELYRIAVPFLILLIFSLIIITYVPTLSLGLLSILGYL